MLLDTVFAPFVKERPICVMARAILERLLDAPCLDALFVRTAQQQYTRELLFSSLVQLMSEVVLGVHPPVHAAYQANKNAIGVSTTALYNKLDRVETEGSAALVRDSAALAEPVIKALRASRPRWVSGYQIKGLDGIIWLQPSAAGRNCAAPGLRPSRATRWWCWTSSVC